MYWDAWSFGAGSKVVLWLLVTGGFHAQVVQQCWFIWLVPEEHAAQGWSPVKAKARFKTLFPHMHTDWHWFLKLLRASVVLMCNNMICSFVLFQLLSQRARVGDQPVPSRDLYLNFFKCLILFWSLFGSKTGSNISQLNKFISAMRWPFQLTPNGSGG